MRNRIFLVTLLALLVFCINTIAHAEQSAWDKTKSGTKEAVSGVKQGSKEAWKKTKQGSKEGLGRG